MGMPGNNTTGKGKIGNSRTPRTLSIASLISQLEGLRLEFRITEFRIIADELSEVSTAPSALRPRRAVIILLSRLELLAGSWWRKSCLIWQNVNVFPVAAAFPR